MLARDVQLVLVGGCDNVTRETLRLDSYSVK